MLTLLGIFIFAQSVLASMGATTYQAKIIKPDGSALEAASVNFQFTILNPAGTCILYAETYAAINMTGTGGLVTFGLGNGTPTAASIGTNFSSVFDNATASYNCQVSGTYSPTPTDGRKIVMQFQDASGWQTLPAMAMNAVPYAMYAGRATSATVALNSQKLNNKADSAFVEYSTLATLGCAADQAIKFNGVSFGCITVGSGGGGSITSVTTSGTVLSNIGTASAPVISISVASMSSPGYITALDYAEFKEKLGASSTQIVNTLGYAPVSSSAVASQINNSNLSGDVSGTVSVNSVVTVGGKTSSQVSTSVDDTLAATTSATANTIVKRNSSGNSTFTDVYASSAKINYVDIYKPSTSFNIRLQAPTSLSTNYVLNLPTASGTSGQVLSTDGAGNLSWTDASTGSVTSVSATAPLVSTGGSTPAISITQATSSTNGYLSSTDFNTFNNKQAATSAAIITTLGYTPADNAASGTYVQKASNLSDLTNIVTARSNLGLGTFATASSIDLGSASATGTLDIARLPSFIGDATIAVASNTIVLSNSGVTAGTYAKVTVDAKGRVTSSSALSASDVTTALGYTPSNSTSGVTSLNGLLTQAQIFSVGTAGTSFGINSLSSTHTFNIPLAATASVTAGLLSNSDYATFTNKQEATSSAIITSLGYTPASAGALGSYLTKANNLSDLVSSATARTNLGLGIFAVLDSLDLGSSAASGTLSILRLPSFTGDVSSVSGSNSIILNAVGSGVTSGTQYTKATVDGKGRVVSGAQLSSIDVTTALGYTPSNSTSGVTSLNGSTSQTQIFANSNTGTAPSYSSVNGVHTLNIPNAASSGVSAGLLSFADWTTFNNKLTSSNNLSDLVSSATARTNLGLGGFATVSSLDLGSVSATGTLAVGRLPAFAGDVTTSAGSSTTTVAAIRGIGVAVTAPTSGQVLAYNGSNWAPVENTSSQWTTSGTTINYLTGNVGIGTSAPGRTLEVGGIISSKQGTVEAAINGNSGLGRGLAGTISNHAFSIITNNSEKITVDASGNIGIGNSTPSTTLDVSGTVKISGGSPGSGKVLTSDASGLASWQTPSGGSLTCPTNYILVPALSGYTSKDFCVAKFEMKNDGYGEAISQASASPLVSIDRPTSRSKCQNLGVGYDLISNNQWQTIARNIADVNANWSSGTAYTGELSRGHSDNAPGSALTASTDDTAGCTGTGQTCSNVTWNSQRRTHTLSNGNVIWDFAGNVWEWVTNDNTASNGADAYASTFTSGVIQTKYGNDTICGTPASNNYCGYGYGYINYSAGAVMRGGDWYSGTFTGVFASHLSVAPSDSGTGIGFRCVFQP